MNPLRDLRTDIADRVQDQITESLAGINQTSALVQGRVIRGGEAIEWAAAVVALAAVVIAVSVVVRNLGDR